MLGGFKNEKMSLLYKPKEEQTVSVSIVQGKEKISIEFSSDCGKFGTDEMLAGWMFQKFLQG